MHIDCPFNYLIHKATSNPDADHIVTANSKNGRLRHYWSTNEVEHIIEHLKNKPCSVTNSKLPDKFDIVLQDIDGKKAEYLYRHDYGKGQTIAAVSKFERGVIILRRIV